MASTVLETLDNEKRRQYIQDHAPDILRSLIVRRSSTSPEQLIDTAIETTGALYDKINPTRRTGFRRVDKSETEPECASTH